MSNKTLELAKLAERGYLEYYSSNCDRCKEPIADDRHVASSHFCGDCAGSSSTHLGGAYVALYNECERLRIALAAYERKEPTP